MTSFIVASKTQDKRNQYINDYCDTLHIHPVDITLITKETSTKTTQSIGIEDIKTMQQKLFLKPIKSNTKAVVLEDAHLLTTEAQNALLKVLEEPPDHTILILSTENKEALLPTIISRCKVIILEADKTTVSKEELHEYSEFINQLSQMRVGDTLKKAELLAKDKDKAIRWIEKLLLVLHEKLTEQTFQGRKAEKTHISMLQEFQNLYVTLKTTNVNTRFAIEQTFLSFCARIEE